MTYLPALIPVLSAWWRALSSTGLVVAFTLEARNCDALSCCVGAKLCSVHTEEA